MQKAAAKFFIMALMLLGLPLAGVALSGKPLAPYLEFPPLTRYVEHAEFSRPVFVSSTLLVLLSLAPLIRRALAAASDGRRAVRPLRRPGFPWWGWAGIILGATSWALAWTRMAWFSPLQHHTFIPLWVAPMLIIVSVQALGKEEHIFQALAAGDWHRAAAAALAALICGFFWEMWNCYSLAKWIYSVPYVQRFHIFEMPLAGYAGYLPFGLECAVIGDLLRRAVNTPPLKGRVLGKPRGKKIEPSGA